MIEGLLAPQHLIILLLVPLLLFVLPFWKILAKAGYPASFSLIAMIPLAWFILLFWLAFSTWPLERAAAQK
jgi:hypothetical protein